MYRPPTENFNSFEIEAWSFEDQENAIYFSVKAPTVDSASLVADRFLSEFKIDAYIACVRLETDFTRAIWKEIEQEELFYENLMSHQKRKADLGI